MRLVVDQHVETVAWQVRQSSRKIWDADPRAVSETAIVGAGRGSVLGEGANGCH
jgi:hypothetical protein